MYQHRTYSQLIVPDGVRCRDPNCKSRIHQAEISEFHESIICSLTASSQPLTVPNNRGTKQAIVPGWNEYVKEHHDAAMDSYWLWREMGKPRNGDVFTLMKLCRSRLNTLFENARGTKKLLYLIGLPIKCVKLISAISGKKFGVL